MYNRDEKNLFSSKAKAGLCSHAYIIDGSSGIGKLDFALYCAKTLLCESQVTKPCSFCPSCQKAQSQNHPDIFVIGKEKAPSIDDVRELIRRSSLKPNDGDKQIFIVNNAGKMRSDAQNALLKLFEEPPQSVALFLLTESRSSLLPTVLSRGQRIHLDGLRDNELKEEISEKYSLSRTELDYVIETANGNLGVAEKYLSKENTALRQKAQGLLLFAFSKNTYELSNALISPKYKREQLQALLDEFVVLINEVLKQRYGVKRTPSQIVSDTDKRLGNATKRALTAMAEYATRSHIALENNGNVTLVASKLAIDLLGAVSR